MPRPVRQVSLAVALTAAVFSLPSSWGHQAARTTSVSGSLTVWDQGDRQAEDVGRAVVWLEGAALDSLIPDTATVLTEQKEFRPRVTVERGATPRGPPKSAGRVSCGSTATSTRR
jgi:hypothetical protein